MSEQEEKGGFPQNETSGQDEDSTTGDGHRQRPTEIGTEEGVAGQGLGQGSKGADAESGGSGSRKQ
ncbi:MAG TPA: hypothetical protein VF723_15095 [Pyrinomonadaceae bacterium]